MYLTHGITKRSNFKWWSQSLITSNVRNSQEQSPYLLFYIFFSFFSLFSLFPTPAFSPSVQVSHCSLWRCTSVSLSIGHHFMNQMEQFQPSHEPVLNWQGPWWRRQYKDLFSNTAYIYKVSSPKPLVSEHPVQPVQTSFLLICCKIPIHMPWSLQDPISTELPSTIQITIIHPYI